MVSNLFIKLASFYRFVNHNIPLDYEHYSINKFMKKAASKIDSNILLLDAGAGVMPYKKYFLHTTYESTDYVHPDHLNLKHTFLCDLQDIPKENNFYEVIINTQTLEHVKDPQKVLHEFYRILKPGGKLFLTAPGCWGVHYAPHHYFNFTNFGLQLMFEKAGFKVVSIQPRGGFFIFIGRMLLEMPFNIYGQYLFRQGISSMTYSQPGKLNFKSPYVYLLLPFFILSLPFVLVIIPLICFLLDFLDRKKDFTIGYN